MTNNPEIACSEIVGRQHGSAFYFNKEDANSFLDHIEARYGADLFQDYFKGFAEGMMGKYADRYEYFDEARI